MISGKIKGQDQRNNPEDRVFRKFRESPYAKAAILVLVCGGLLIIFNNWITKNRISIGFENINSTLAPIYIGGILAFILCPVYNACVKWCYQRMLARMPSEEGFSIGAMLVQMRRRSPDVDKEENEKY